VSGNILESCSLRPLGSIHFAADALDLFRILNAFSFTGKGSFGEVFKGYAIRTQKAVAIKGKVSFSRRTFGKGELTRFLLQ